MKNGQVVNSWADALADRLGRSAADIRERGLSAYDFPADEVIDVQFDFGDSMRFQFAFFIVDDERGKVAVFTEHSGYFEFSSRSLKLISTKTTVYIGEDYGC